MMASATNLDDEAFLFDFAARHPTPRARDIIVAKEARPDLAEAIVQLALTLNGSALVKRTTGDDVANESDENLVRDVFTRVASEADEPDLHDMFRAAGKTMQDISDTVELPLRAVAEMADGGCRPPISPFALAVLGRTLGVAPVTVAAGVLASAASPRLGLSKSTSSPEVLQRTFAEIIASCDMSDERKAAWLSD